MTDNLDTNTIGYESLGADINKRKGESTSENTQGIDADKIPELSLDMDDDKIVKLADKWEKEWKESPKKTEWETQITDNEKYWLGQQFDQPRAAKQRPMADNVIFEALETYLPQATRRNPEALVTLDHSEVTDSEKEQYVQQVKLRLGDLADKNRFRLKLKKGARHWAIYQLGVAKFGWNLDEDHPQLRIIRPKKMILDPECTIDEDGYTGARIGEYRKMEASKLLAIVGDKAEQTDPETGEVIEKGNQDFIKALKEEVGDDLATEVTFQEWWTDKFMFWRYKKHIALKIKNPHWNYDQTAETPEPNVDDYGNETTPLAPDEPIKGINHFAVPKMPYSFLSVFNLGDQPMDKTGLINQNLANQDKVNKRDKQIDKNADRMNGGLVVSLARSGLTKDQATGVTKALRKGGVVCIPDGSPRDAIDQYNPVGLPADVFNDRNDTRTRLRDIFGVSGSSQSGLSKDDTVRGKIVSRAADTDRIGGGVTEYLEQWSDDWFNWYLQLLYVYDKDFQFQNGKTPPKLVVSVKEGSLLPKDSTSLANQAMDLAKEGKMSTLDLFKKLEYSNAEEMAANAWLEANAPQIMFKNNPLVAEAMQMKMQIVQAEQQNKIDIAAGRQMKYEDLPPAGKVQLAAKAGITLSPDDIAMEELKKATAKVVDTGMKNGSVPADNGNQTT